MKNIIANLHLPPDDAHRVKRARIPGVYPSERTDSMSKFRKKPVVIDAVRLTQDAVDAHVLDKAPLPDGCYVSSSESHKDRREVHRAVVRLKNHTRDLVMPGDWIVRDAVGALSVCKPEVFAATYESAVSPNPATDAGLTCELGWEE